MIATIAVIAAIAEKKKKFSDRRDDSDHKETTFQPLQQQRSLESGFNMIAMIAAIAELLFSSAIVVVLDV